MEEPTIIKLLEKQDSNLNIRLDKMEDNMKEYVDGSISLNHANMINLLDPLIETQRQTVAQNAVRNHRIEKTEDEVDALVRETTFSRWVQNHPKSAAVILLAVIAIGVIAYHNRNFLKTVENTTGVVIEQPIGH